MADPASRGAVPADVRERSLKVPVRSAERHLLYCLVQDQVLQKTKKLIRVKFYPNLISNLSITQYGS